jgi:hypothetical protein
MNKKLTLPFFQTLLAQKKIMMQHKAIRTPPTIKKVATIKGKLRPPLSGGDAIGTQ